MSKIKRLILYFVFIFFSLSVLAYFTYLFLVPYFFNSVKVDASIQKYIFDRTQIQVSTTNLKFKTYKNLDFSVFADDIEVNLSDKNLFRAKNVNLIFSPLFKHNSNINADIIYIDKNELSKIINTNKKRNKKFNFNLNLLNKVSINKIIVKYDENINILVSDFFVSFNPTINRFLSSFDLNISSEFLKNNISVKNQNNINFDNEYINFNKIKVFFGNDFLTINGKIGLKDKSLDLLLQGANIPVSDIQSSVLYFFKQKNKKKNFMENFVNYKGSADLDLKIENSGLYGEVELKSLGATTVLFNVPVKFKNFSALFNGNQIHAEAYGKLGYDDVYTDFHLINYKKEKRKIYGRVHSEISNNNAKKYLPDLTINGKVNANVLYTIENSIPKIVYIAKFDENTNIQYKTINPGLIGKKRRLYVSTQKYPDKLYINKYDYSLQNGSKILEILTGEGLFETINKKLKPSYITIKTITPAPVSVAGSFGRRINGGEFEGNLKFDFKKEILTGNFNLINSKYKNFFIEHATIDANDNYATITSKGMYHNSPYSCYINLQNEFKDVITVNKIDLFLDTFYIKKKIHQKSKKIKINVPEKIKEFSYIVKQGKISLNNIIYDKIIVRNIILVGSLKNNLANFVMDNASFANGNLKANGSYNLDNNEANIQFSADNLDSDAVATMVFSLPEQIKGTAEASLKAHINTETRKLNATADFSIKQGYMPKIGNTEFLVRLAGKEKKPLRIKLSDIINIDIDKAKSLASDIQGSFEMNDLTLKNVELYSKQKYLSLFVEGEYDIEKENANLRLWGKYNKTARNKVKIFFVPLSIIMNLLFRDEPTKDLYKSKISKIPPVTANKNEVEYFRVKIKGNLNNNDVKVELKSLK